MNLVNLAAEYKMSEESCRRRAAELSKIMRQEELSESRKIELRRRIAILSTMARDTIAVSNYLDNYYIE